jgi:hypothetical protein
MQGERMVPSGYGFDWPHELDAIMNRVDSYASARARQACRLKPDWTHSHRLRAELATALHEAWTRVPAPVAEPVADALRLIGGERCRQVDAEGWTLDHDDQHTDGSLAIAAAHYALSSQWWRSSDFRVLAPAGSDEQREKILARGPLNFGGGNDCYNWPWDLDWWKPKGQVEDLVRAGALIVAEIERIARASTPIASPADMEATNDGR